MIPFLLIINKSISCEIGGIEMKNFKFKKKYIYILLILVMLVSLVYFTTIPVSADVGNNNRYDSDSGSGGGDGSIIDLIYFLYILFDIFGIWALPIILIIVLVFASSSYRKNFVDNEPQKRHQNTIVHSDPRKEAHVERLIQEIDPNFSSEEFKQKAAECFMILQKAWTERDWEKIRPFESDALFNLHDEQLREYINNHQINVVEKIKISSTELLSFKVLGDKDVLNVRLDAVMRDYIIDDQTKQLLEGSKTKDIYSSYRMEFVRTHGVKTEEGKSVSTTNCPNCGAPTTVTSTGKCSYCDSLITSGNYSWVLNELTTL